jgi:hypothetical protein
MNLYLRLADHVGTLAARDLAAQLVAWHDAMVKHARVVGTQREVRCGEECPHADARVLWAAALETFGELAAGLTFLQRHGQRGQTPGHVIPVAASEARP